MVIKNFLSSLRLFYTRHLHRFFCSSSLVAFALILPAPSLLMTLDPNSEVFFQNDVIFYDPTEHIRKSNCFSLNGGANIVAGNDIQAKIWNFFVNANIPDLSNNPAVIAGIMGNLQQESNFNPFAVTGKYHGLFQTNTQEFLDLMQKAGLSKFWNQTNVPQDAVDKAVALQLNYLVKNANVASGPPLSFLSNVKIVSTPSPESFAELFLVTYERAVNGKHLESNKLTDHNVQNFVKTKLYPRRPQYHTYFQETGKRSKYARTIFDKFAKNTNNISVNTNRSSSVFDSNGWIKNNALNITKQVPTHTSEPIKKSYTTGKPNKILLHNTEGTANGLAAYPQNNLFPAHFTVDLVKKQGYQHFSIWQPSLAIIGDENGPIQIEIVGFKNQLQNFSSDAWDYLAAILKAIHQATGIPLSSSVRWDHEARMKSVDSFKNYQGILGHMHAPKNDHDDPGNIWPQLSSALHRDPDLKDILINTPSNQPIDCDESPSVTDEKGLSQTQAQEIMSKYKDANPSDYGLVKYRACKSALGNCVAFVSYFLQQYAHQPKGIVLGNGSKVVSNLIHNYGFEDGGRIPKPFAVFSVASGKTMCGNTLCGHTGIVLGIDKSTDTIIIGEAGCSIGVIDHPTKYKLSTFTNGNYTYAYTDKFLSNQLKF